MSDTLTEQARIALATEPAPVDLVLTPMRRTVPAVAIRPELVDIVDGILAVTKSQIEHYKCKAWLDPEEVQALAKLNEIVVKLSKEDRAVRKEPGEFTSQELVEILKEATK